VSEALILHEDPRSGNCYKVALTAALVGVPIERKQYDIVKGETRTQLFLGQVNANGRIPVLQIGDQFLPESNAACFYLADGSSLIPEERFGRADMLRWMFFEQYNHEPNVATLRFWLRHVGKHALSEAQRALIPGKRTAGEAALKLMDKHLSENRYFVGDRLSLADVALYAYTHVAGEGGFDLSYYPDVVRWLGDVSAEPGFIPMS
jgi:glutathione S-transferase